MSRWKGTHVFNLQRLRVLSEFARLGTVGAVAAQLNYTHSAISQQLAQLEAEAGCPLTERDGRRLRLTAKGEQLVDYAERLLALAREAEAAMATEEVRGTVRLGSFQSVLSGVVPTAIAELAQRHPGLTVRVFQRELAEGLDDLRARRLDLLLGEEFSLTATVGASAASGLHREHLVDDPWVLITPPSGPWSARELGELAAAPWALDPPGTPPGSWAHAACWHAGFSPRVVYETIDPMLQAQLVADGHAVAMVSGLLVPHLEGVRRVRLPGDPTRRLYSVVNAGREHLPALRAVRAALARALPAGR